QFDPVISGKYRLRPNLSVAAVMDTTEGFKDSVMILSGLPGNRLVLGVGANLALEGTETEAHFGRYPSRFSEVDPLFFLLGGSINIDPDTEFTMDYAGDEFVLGLRHHFNEAMGLDFGYITPDHFQQENRYFLGMNFGL
ncbi:hypothetical protein HYY75_02665, partial [bacterium]|nr:hypothetical protein [bacterium]